MNKTQQILNNKSTWALALENTIAKYDACIETKRRISSQMDNCPLCLTAQRIGNHEKLSIHETCHDCIHTTTLGQGKQCYRQISFNKVRALSHNTLLDLRNDDHNNILTAMKYRQSYLQRLLNKLKDYV